MLYHRFEKLVARLLLKLPDSILYLLSGGVKKIAGRQLDARLQMALLLAGIKPRWEKLVPQKARIESKKTMDLFDLGKTTLRLVEDFYIESGDSHIPVRMYIPVKAKGPLPAVVYFHGGGFVIGDLDTHDHLARYLSYNSHCIFFSVDYRLSPEYPFPTPIEDCWAFYEFLLKNHKKLGCDINRIAVAGDSAGGNAVINVCKLAQKKKKQMPALQILIYPWLDLSQEAESYEIYAEGFALTRPLLSYFRQNYLGKEFSEDPMASPLLHKSFKNLPPALVQIAGFDPLQDEAKQLVERFKKDKVPVQVEEYPSLIHGFVSVAGVVPKAREALDHIASRIESSFHSIAVPKNS